MVTKQTQLEFLSKVKALLEGGWSQGCSARDANGKNISFDSPDAVSFCVVGACMRSWSLKMPYTDYMECVKPIAKTLIITTQYTSIQNWNDELFRTKEEVLKLMENTCNFILKKAINELSKFP